MTDATTFAPAAPNLYICAGLVALGIIAHFVKKLYDLEQTGTIMSPLTYVRMHPYQVLMAWLGAYLLMIAFYYFAQLTPMLALLTGVACNEAFDTLRTKAVLKIREGEAPAPEKPQTLGQGAGLAP